MLPRTASNLNFVEDAGNATRCSAVTGSSVAATMTVRSSEKLFDLVQITAEVRSHCWAAASCSNCAFCKDSGKFEDRANNATCPVVMPGLSPRALPHPRLDRVSQESRVYGVYGLTLDRA